MSDHQKKHGISACQRANVRESAYVQRRKSSLVGTRKELRSAKICTNDQPANLSSFEKWLLNQDALI